MILIIFTFQGNDFIKESIKDTDPEVVERFEAGGGWDKVWENYEDGEPQNPYDSKEDLIANCPIVATKDGYIRSGRAFAFWGMRYEYEPILKVSLLLLSILIFPGLWSLKTYDDHFQPLRVPSDLQLH